MQNLEMEMGCAATASLRNSWEREHTEDMPSKKSSRRLRTLLTRVPSDHKLHADTCISQIILNKLLKI